MVLSSRACFEDNVANATQRDPRKKGNHDSRCTFAGPCFELSCSNAFASRPKKATSKQPNNSTMTQSTFADYKSFTGMKTGQEHDSNGTSFVESVVGNELRVGKYCMIGGFPCKIKELHRAAPGKHGHAKLRTVGLGVFDDKKREIIYGAQQVVQVPVIQKLQDVHCVTAKDGFHVETGGHYCLPAVLDFPGEDSNLKLPSEGQHVILSVIVACGHYKITDVCSTTGAVEDQVLTEQSQVLSRKEARKLKKKKKKEPKLESNSIC